MFSTTPTHQLIDVNILEVGKHRKVVDVDAHHGVGCIKATKKNVATY
jgi:acetoin utilization deacetylase AcuC-like enzyme